MKEQVKKVAAIHDISGLGRCSLTAVIPILSVLGVQACPFPTAVLSLQTGYEDFHFCDLNYEMKNYKKSWSKANVKFAGIYSGFLGSEKQIDTVIEFIDEHKESLILIDPVMGDDGEKYPIYNDDMCKKMKELIKKGDIITPNLTEALLLIDGDFKNFKVTEENLLLVAKKLSSLGPSKIIITGIIDKDIIKNFIYDADNNTHFEVNVKWNKKNYSGTGDMFASIICAMIINGFTIETSVNKAVDFIRKAIEFTDIDSDPRNGVNFEPMLKELFI